MKKKHGATPTPAMSTPPMRGADDARRVDDDGVEARRRWPGRRARPSRTRSSARDGMPSAVAVPVRPASTQIIHTVTTSVAVSTPRTSASSAAADLRGEEQLALVDAVGERAGPGPEHQHGAELQAHGDAQVHAAAGELQHQPALGDRLHPGAAHGDDLAEEEQAVVVDAQRAERAREAGRAARRGGSCAGHAAGVYPSPDAAAHARRRYTCRRARSDLLQVDLPPRILTCGLGRDRLAQPERQRLAACARASRRAPSPCPRPRSRRRPRAYRPPPPAAPGGTSAGTSLYCFRAAGHARTSGRRGMCARCAPGRRHESTPVAWPGVTSCR